MGREPGDSILVFFIFLTKIKKIKKKECARDNPKPVPPFFFLPRSSKPRVSTLPLSGKWKMCRRITFRGKRVGVDAREMMCRVIMGRWDFKLKVCVFFFFFSLPFLFLLFYLFLISFFKEKMVIIRVVNW